MSQALIARPSAIAYFILATLSWISRSISILIPQIRVWTNRPTADSTGIQFLVANKSSWDADTGEAWMHIQGTTYLSGLDFSEDERAGRGSVADLFTTFSPSM